MNLSEGVFIGLDFVVVMGLILLVVIGVIPVLELAVFGSVRTSLVFRFAAGGTRYLVRLGPR
jgi:hypothetical protein